jgi:predicted Zn-dependent peptidase
MIPILMVCLSLVEAPQITRLANGVPLITLVEQNTDEVSIQCLLKTTELSYNETATLQALEAVVFNETTTLSKNKLAYLVAFVGQNANVEWSQDVFRIEITTKSSHVEPAIAIVTDILKRTVIKDSTDAHKHLDYIKRNLLSQPHEQAIIAALARQNIAPPQHQNIGAQNLQITWERLAKPQNLAIAILGNFEREQTIRTLAASLSSWKGTYTQINSPLPHPPSSAAPPNFQLGGMLVEGPKPDHPDFAAWLVLAYAIGENKGSEIAQFARYQGAFAYATGLRIGFRKQAPWALAWFLSTAPPKGASQNFVQQMQRPRSLLNERQLIRARALAMADYEHGQGKGMGAFRQGHTSLAERAFWLAWWELNGGYRLDALFPQRLREVTLEQLHSIAEKWLPSAKALDAF